MCAQTLKPSSDRPFSVERGEQERFSYRTMHPSSIHLSIYLIMPVKCAFDRTLVEQLLPDPAYFCSSVRGCAKVLNDAHALRDAANWWGGLSNCWRFVMDNGFRRSSEHP